MRNRRAGALLLGLGLACLAAVACAEGGPSFHASFDGTAIADLCEVGKPEPTIARGLTYVPGVTGQAVFLGQSGKGPYEQMPLLEYDGGQHFTGDGGTVMFWVSPDWDGYFTDPIHFDTYFLFSAMGGRKVPDFATNDVAPDSGCDRLWLFMWNWLRCDLHEEAGKPSASLSWMHQGK